MKNEFKSFLFCHCQLNSRIIISSNFFQCHNDINWQDDLICYQTDWQRWMFAQIIYFVKIHCAAQSIIQSCFLAFIRDYINIDIDKHKQVVSFRREEKHSWISVFWIQSLFNVIQKDDVNLIVTDIDIYKWMSDDEYCSQYLQLKSN